MGQTTIKDVARRAGVSFQTVSLVLNHPREGRPDHARDHRDGHARPGLRAQPRRPVPAQEAQSQHRLRVRSGAGARRRRVPARTRRPSTATSCRPSAPSPTSRATPWSTAAAAAADPDGLSRIASLVSEARVDGLAVFAEGRDDPLIGLLQAKRCPFVVFGLDVPGTHFAARAERDAVRGAVRHLIAAGSRSICLLAGDGRCPPAVTERFRGYREALAEAGLPLRDDLVVPCDGTSAGGYRAARALLERPEIGAGSRPDAVVAASDRAAFGVLKALHEGGVRVPAEIRVVGFGNLTQAAYAVPSLTSVDVPTLDMVRFAFATLVELIEGTRAPDDLAQKLFPTRLVVRESSAAAAALAGPAAGSRFGSYPGSHSAARTPAPASPRPNCAACRRL
ncbi:LacI family DNA-binding transcriptional regulator [Methylobacterium oryzae CBMB20]